MFYGALSFVGKPFLSKELTCRCERAVTVAVERRESFWPVEVLLEVLHDSEFDPDRILDRGEFLLTAIESILFDMGDLSEREQQALSLYVRGFERVAAARALGVAKSTYRNTLLRARDKCGAEALGELLRVVALELNRRDKTGPRD